ncbi:MAG: hypothetical protein WC241_04625 [Candidatus Paceibacterota bacterium]|jgi:hypothetical protein
MKLFRVLSDGSVHKLVSLPHIVNKHICATGRVGPLCKKDYGFVYFANIFEGKKEDITCKKCRSLVNKNMRRKTMGKKTLLKTLAAGAVGAVGAVATVALLDPKNREAIAKKGEDVLQKSKELGAELVDDAKSLGNDLVVGTKSLGSDALATGKGLVSAGLGHVHDGVGNLKAKLDGTKPGKKPVRKPAAAKKKL